MPLDFPSNPINGQQFENYVYDSAARVWRNYGTVNGLAPKLVSLESSKVGKADNTTIEATINFSGANMFNNVGYFSGATQTFNNNNVVYGPGVVGSVISYSKSMQLSTSAQNVFTANDNVIPYNGTYLVKIESLDSYANGGVSYGETYAGIMYWYKDDTNSDNADNIGLHRMGHAPNYESIGLRTLRTIGVNGTQSFQIWSNVNWSSAKAINFTFRRIN